MILFKPLMKNVGSGRVGYLSKPLKLKDVVEKMKFLFQMKTIRIALANGKTLGIIPVFFYLEFFRF